MNASEYRTSRRRTMNHDLTVPLQKLNASLGLGETGELQNLIKKEIFHSHPTDSSKILDEAGDILFYLDWLLELYGWTFSDAFVFNKEKLAARYPEGFSSERSINRDSGGS